MRMVQTARGGYGRYHDTRDTAPASPPPVQPAKYIQIAALTPESWGHNMVVRVLGIEELTGGRGADVLLGDETGTIKFRAAPGQVDLFRHKEVVVIRNASVRMLEPGVFMRLTVNGKWGKVSEHPDGVRSTPAPPKTVNHDNNKSSVEYELVPVPDDEDDN